MKDLFVINEKGLRLIIGSLIIFSGRYDYRSDEYKEIYDVIRDLEKIEKDRKENYENK